MENEGDEPATQRAAFSDGAHWYNVDQGATSRSGIRATPNSEWQRTSFKRYFARLGRRDHILIRVAMADNHEQ